MSSIRNSATVRRPIEVDRGRAGATRVLRGRRALLAAAAAGAAALVAAGCGAAAAGSSSVPTTVGPAAIASPAPGAPGVAAKIVDARLTEFKIALSDARLGAGRYTFVATNAGHTLHSLSIKGPGVAATLPSALQPGSSGRVTVTLAAGRYDVYCPVGDHKALGMNVELTVGAASGSGPVATSATTGTGNGH